MHWMLPSATAQYYLEFSNKYWVVMQHLFFGVCAAREEYNYLLAEILLGKAD